MNVFTTEKAGNDDDKGKLLKSKIMAGTDPYKFNVLPGGYRYTNGYFNAIGKRAQFWCSTEYDALNVCFRSFRSGFQDLSSDIIYKTNGYSVRCLKDSE